jgi:hypothetical protein
LIVPEAAMTFGFGVFLLRQFFLSIPGELEDAARIDGASPWDFFLALRGFEWVEEWGSACGHRLWERFATRLRRRANVA